MKWLIIQSAGQNEKNAFLRECNGIAHGLTELRQNEVNIWGLRHPNYDQIPDFESSRAVPPLEIISQPRSTNTLANSTMPVLSYTDINARGEFIWFMFV